MKPASEPLHTGMNARETGRGENRPQKGKNILLAFGIILFAVVLFLWQTGIADHTWAFFGAISALLTILSAYELEHSRKESE